MIKSDTIDRPKAQSDEAVHQPELPPNVNERLCHLFRASLKIGRIHPLYLPVLRYRHSRAAT